MTADDLHPDDIRHKLPSITTPLTGGTYRSARAGEVVSTADYLRELAARARRMGDEGWGPLQPKQWRFFADWLGSLTEAGEPNGVLFRPDAPQPAVADDTAERAARALFVAEQETDETRDAAGRYWDNADFSDAVIPREHYRNQARAALAAAGAGEAVDREALIEQVEDILARHGCLAAVPTQAIRDLAARGDAATPTEPRWGWDLGPDDPRGVRTEADEATARREVARFPRDRRLMRREVTAWREVEGGEQRA